MDFEQNLSFEENLDQFLTHTESLDADCAKILSDRIDILRACSTGGNYRAAVREFNQSVLEAVYELSESDKAEEI